MKMQEKFDEVRRKLERAMGGVALPKDVKKMSYEQYIRARLTAKRLMK